MKNLYLILFSLFFNTFYCQYIQINDQYTAQQLVEDILINSPCASISNIKISGANFTNGNQSYGYFSKNGSNFPFADGVILSTGKAILSEGPNTFLQDMNAPGWKGDSDLEKALGLSSGSTVNATIIEFDFLPIANKMSFEYLFASEEYHDTAQCIYSDGFAFLLKKVGDPDSSYQNLALIPNTNIPVQVTTIHPAVPKGCPAQNEQYFGGYNNSSTSAINFNGQTVVLTAKANVTPGVTYHIKLVIADEANYRYDSAIFLGGGSFKVETDLGEDRLLSNDHPLCEKETLTLDASQPNATGFKWFKDGIPLPGETNHTYTITPESGSGTYSVEVTLSSTSCISTGKIQVEYSTVPAASTVPLNGCDYDNDGKAFFNLNNAKSAIISQPENYNFTFYKQNPETNPNAQLISGDLSHYQNSTNPESVFAKVENEYGCWKVSEIKLIVNPAAISQTTSLPECDTTGNGAASFDLKSNFPNTTFYSSLTDLERENNPLPSPFTSSGTTIYGLQSNGTSCGEVIKINLIISPYAGPSTSQNIVTCPRDISPKKPYTLTALPGYFSYKWNTGQTGQTLSITQPGTYVATVFNQQGCSFTQTFNVSFSQAPNIISIKVDGSTLEAITDIKGDFEYSLDQIQWQTSPIFKQLSSGTYTIYVRTLNTKCMGGSKQAVIFFIPNFFSPNGDGINDEWTITGFDIYPDATIKVFNRYGKLLLDKKPNGKIFHWDGKSNGTTLPQDSYWYVVKLNDEFILTGWIMIKNYNNTGS